MGREVLCPPSWHILPCRVYFTSICPLPGKKDGEMDRNFDTLDLPKRTEAAKGEWAEAEFNAGPSG